MNNSFVFSALKGVYSKLLQSNIIHQPHPKAKSVLLTHHSPQRTDKMIESYKKDLKKQSKFKNLDFDFAKESIIYPVGKK